MRIRSIKFRDLLERGNFTSSAKTEHVPAINACETEVVETYRQRYETELMPIYTEEGIITRTWAAIRALK